MPAAPSGFCGQKAPPPTSADVRLDCFARDLGDGDVAARRFVTQSSVDVTLDSASLFSPQLGMAVISDATTSGKVAGSPFSSHQVTSLRSHP